MRHLQSSTRALKIGIYPPKKRVRASNSIITAERATETTR